MNIRLLPPRNSVCHAQWVN